MTAPEKENGWRMPYSGKRFHYFRNGVSLCRKYDGFMSIPAYNGEPHETICCRQCFRKLMREP